MKTKKKILLALLPFWTPQIPPLGIASLETFLKREGFDVVSVDANVEQKFAEIYNKYFFLLKRGIPTSKQGNIYITGYDLMQNHMMAHLHKKNEIEYLECIKNVIYNTFFINPEKELIVTLSQYISSYYGILEKYIEDLLDEYIPDVFGISTFGNTLPSTIKAFQVAKKKDPDIRNVMGGGVFSDYLALGSPNLEIFLKKTVEYIDNLFIGEGELLFLDYLNDKLPGAQRIYTQEDLQCKSLDISDFSIINFSSFKMDKYPSIPSYISRSCPFQCSFCSETVMWGKYRSRPIEKVVVDFEKVSSLYKNQLIYLCDSLLNPVINKLSDKVFKSGFTIYWEGYLRIDKNIADIDKVFLWRNGGFYKAWIGIESGSQHVLDLMHKGITTDQIKTSIMNLAEAGIKTSTLWIIGYPGETEDDFKKTLDVIEELKDELYEVWCTPFTCFMEGQSNARSWKNDCEPLYQAGHKDLLMLDSYKYKGNPSREIAYKRMNLFMEHSRKLGIPMAVTLEEIYKADERWKKLHRNAVPSLFDLFDNTTDECKYIKRS